MADSTPTALKDSPYHSKMNGCTLRLARNSPLRTTLVDEATGEVKYKIETPMRIARSVTRIRKLELRTQSPPHWDKGADSDSGDVISKGKKSNSREEGEDMGPEVHEASDEIARIYWKWFSPNRFIFRGRITTRKEFLPKSGRLGG